MKIEFAQPFMVEADALAAAEAVRSRWIVGGPRLKMLEDAFSERTGMTHSVGVNSWTSAGFLVLHAWDIRPGDEVIVPSSSFIATANIVRHCGADPVFCEIDPDTWNIDANDIEHRITPRTKAIVTVDQLGNPCDLGPILAIARRHGLKVLHDAACSLGSLYEGQPIGAGADAVVYSLHARKIVTCGEGGMICTEDGGLAHLLKLLRHQGMSASDDKRHGNSPTNFETYPVVGFNFRITDIQASVALSQFSRLDEILTRRRELAERYEDALQKISTLRSQTVLPNAVMNWQSYQVQLTPSAKLTRNEVMDHLWAAGIPTRRGVMIAHTEPPYRPLNVKLPVTEHVEATSFQLPMHTGLPSDHQEYVIDKLQQLMS
ncbi:MAG: DegT/DnrJ/EryC1/StrS family aminotransferase [Novosphingobium sp.]|jgi:perosamine synthetase|uniref:DegT/DnrJ/EryC1/StrS family aminotransferase n=1 Tax=Novosphingobium sp. TaxID=1874826 RepID=UPI0022C0B8BE|nr:DegT/DnrJ/EryC1/StrS family aminotransferase [Novosphingobium sp.]MCZ8035943.1 DegT/DnrJ/EryC1/StrS family aminotransferase [Novosphingobium sp.]